MGGLSYLSPKIRPVPENPSPKILFQEIIETRSAVYTRDPASRLSGGQSSPSKYQSRLTSSLDE
jgi:hypothetical protein